MSSPSDDDDDDDNGHPPHLEGPEGGATASTSAILMTMTGSPLMARTESEEGWRAQGRTANADSISGPVLPVSGGLGATEASSSSPAAAGDTEAHGGGGSLPISFTEAQTNRRGRGSLTRSSVTKLDCSALEAVHIVAGEETPRLDETNEDDAWGGGGGGSAVARKAMNAHGKKKKKHHSAHHKKKKAHKKLDDPRDHHATKGYSTPEQRYRFTRQCLEFGSLSYVDVIHGLGGLRRRINHHINWAYWKGRGVGAVFKRHAKHHAPSSSSVSAWRKIAMEDPVGSQLNTGPAHLMIFRPEDRAYFDVSGPMSMDHAPDFDMLPRNQLEQFLRERYDPYGQADPGDPMYTLKGLLERESIFFHPLVRQVLDMIMFVTDGNGDRHIGFQEYRALHKKMCLTIYGQRFLKRSHAQQEKVLREDWLVDCDGHDNLNYHRFTFCWFQLADRFTENVDAQEYASFLLEILGRMTQEDPKSGKLQLRKHSAITQIGSDPGADMLTMERFQEIRDRTRAERMAILQRERGSGDIRNWSHEPPPEPQPTPRAPTTEEPLAEMTPPPQSKPSMHRQPTFSTSQRPLSRGGTSTAIPLVPMARAPPTLSNQGTAVGPTEDSGAPRPRPSTAIPPTSVKHMRERAQMPNRYKPLREQHRPRSVRQLVAKPPPTQWSQKAATTLEFPGGGFDQGGPNGNSNRRSPPKEQGGSRFSGQLYSSEKLSRNARARSHSPESDENRTRAWRHTDNGHKPGLGGEGEEKETEEKEGEKEYKEEKHHHDDDDDEEEEEEHDDDEEGEEEEEEEEEHEEEEEEEDSDDDILAIGDASDGWHPMGFTLGHTGRMRKANALQGGGRASATLLDISDIEMEGHAKRRTKRIRKERKARQQRLEENNDDDEEEEGDFSLHGLRKTIPRCFSKLKAAISMLSLGKAASAHKILAPPPPPPPAPTATDEFVTYVEDLRRFKAEAALSCPPRDASTEARSGVALFVLAQQQVHAFSSARKAELIEQMRHSPGGADKNKDGKAHPATGPQSEQEPQQQQQQRPQSALPWFAQPRRSLLASDETGRRGCSQRVRQQVQQQELASFTSFPSRGRGQGPGWDGQQPQQQVASVLRASSPSCITNWYASSAPSQPQQVQQGQQGLATSSSSSLLAKPTTAVSEDGKKAVNGLLLRHIASGEPPGCQDRPGGGQHPVAAGCQEQAQGNDSRGHRTPPSSSNGNQQQLVIQQKSERQVEEEDVCPGMIMASSLFEDCPGDPSPGGTITSNAAQTPPLSTREDTPVATPPRGSGHTIPPGAPAGETSPGAVESQQRVVEFAFPVGAGSPTAAAAVGDTAAHAPAAAGGGSRTGSSPVVRTGSMTGGAICDKRKKKRAHVQMAADRRATTTTSRRPRSAMPLSQSQSTSQSLPLSLSLSHNQGMGARAATWASAVSALPPSAAAHAFAAAARGKVGGQAGSLLVPALQSGSAAGKGRGSHMGSGSHRAPPTSTPSLTQGFSGGHHSARGCASSCSAAVAPTVAAAGAAPAAASPTSAHGTLQPRPSSAFPSMPCPAAVTIVSKSSTSSKSASSFTAAAALRSPVRIVDPASLLATARAAGAGGGGGVSPTATGDGEDSAPPENAEDDGAGEEGGPLNRERRLPSGEGGENHVHHIPSVLSASHLVERHPSQAVGDAALSSGGSGGGGGRRRSRSSDGEVQLRRNRSSSSSSSVSRRGETASRRVGSIPSGSRPSPAASSLAAFGVPFLGPAGTPNLAAAHETGARILHQQQQDYHQRQQHQQQHHQQGPESSALPPQQHHALTRYTPAAAFISVTPSPSRRPQSASNVKSGGSQASLKLLQQRRREAQERSPPVPGSCSWGAGSRGGGGEGTGGAHNVALMRVLQQRQRQQPGGGRKQQQQQQQRQQQRGRRARGRQRMTRHVGQEEEEEEEEQLETHTQTQGHHHHQARPHPAIRRRASSEGFTFPAAAPEEEGGERKKTGGTGSVLYSSVSALHRGMEEALHLIEGHVDT